MEVQRCMCAMEARCSGACVDMEVQRFWWCRGAGVRGACAVGVQRWLYLIYTGDADVLKRVLVQVQRSSCSGAGAEVQVHERGT